MDRALAYRMRYRRDIDRRDPDRRVVLNPECHRVPFVSLSDER